MTMIRVVRIEPENKVVMSDDQYSRNRRMSQKGVHGGQLLVHEEQDEQEDEKGGDQQFRRHDCWSLRVKGCVHERVHEWMLIWVEFRYSRGMKWGFDKCGNERR